MKAPTNYGSENEETSFIRRVAAPDRPNANRRQKKRLALAGAAVTLIAASAVVGYATMCASTVDTAATTSVQQMEASMEVPDFVLSLGDEYFPTFDKLDQDGNNVVTDVEYDNALKEKWAADKQQVASSDLPSVIKDDLDQQLDNKLQVETSCVQKAMKPTKTKSVSFNRGNIYSLYNMLKVLCMHPHVAIPHKLLDQSPTTIAPLIIAEPESPSMSENEPAVQTVDATTPSGTQEEVTVVGAPVDGQQTVVIPTGDGGQTTTQVVAEPTANGQEEELEIPTDNGETATVVVTPAEPESPSMSESEPAVQTVDVTSPSGTQKEVTVIGKPVYGEQSISIPDGNDGTELVMDVAEEPIGVDGEKLEVPNKDGGDTTVVIQPNLRVGVSTSEIVEQLGGYDQNEDENPTIAGEQTVEVPMSEGGEEDVMVVGDPVDGQQTVVIPTGDGGQTTTQVVAEPTANGQEEVLEIPTDNGETATVVVTPAEPETEPVMEPAGETTFMTKDEFQLTIGGHFADKIMQMKQRADSEEADSVKLQNGEQMLEGCIEQAANNVSTWSCRDESWCDEVLMVMVVPLFP
ncbi:hypothetical protein BBJ28_00026299 [Nothophytophthora sp. Chile5]|nr:hypothetical protein BBJ28_00026299 [Nothophytophthora sp. Chile5]